MAFEKLCLNGAPVSVAASAAAVLGYSRMIVNRSRNQHFLLFWLIPAL